MNELALFAGAGGGILGGYLLGWQTICAVERDAYAAGVLAQRQNDGCLPPFPIWSDVTTFDGTKWRGRVDVISGGFPCQDISISGTGEGIDGSRSGLWSEFSRIIGEVRPEFVFVENSPMLASRGMGRVLGDLAAMGYDAEWGVLGASDCCGDHHRKRIWILGHSNRNRLEGSAKNSDGRKKKKDSMLRGSFAGTHSSPAWDRFNEQAPTRMVGNADELAWRVDRLKAVGNGQVPRVAARAWNELISRL